MTKYSFEDYDKEERSDNDHENQASESYDRRGFDRHGLHRNGTKYDYKGYDVNGYNKDGFDALGYDREGNMFDGFDTPCMKHNPTNSGNEYAGGYNKKNYDENGYNRVGRKEEVYDKTGYDKMGYNREGYDRAGYDKAGYNREGYDKAGYDQDGYNKSGFDREGYDRDGYDSEGYCRRGFDKNGVNRYTKTDRDLLGFDVRGIDKKGYDICRGTLIGERRFGGGWNIYDTITNKQKRGHFFDLYCRYVKEDYKCAMELYTYFCNGSGLHYDRNKAFKILVDAAYEQRDVHAIRKLAEHLCKSDEVGGEQGRAEFYEAIMAGEKRGDYKDFYAGQSIDFVSPKERYLPSPVYEEENNHLKSVLLSIENRKKLNNQHKKDAPLERGMSWMDRDQREDWLEKREWNRTIDVENTVLELIAERPYYARMDYTRSEHNECVYIGEREYDGIVSVWSELGRKYREYALRSFVIANERHDVKLRRRIHIVDGELVDIFDDFNMKDSRDVEGDAKGEITHITDPFLLQILREKRGEKNLTNIIRTIQSNQNCIIEEDINKNIIVQGCAGSGKTMIMLHRLANMKYNNPMYNWDQVKIITPNEKFSFYVDELSKNLQIDEIKRMTLQEYYVELLEQYRSQYQESKLHEDWEVKWKKSSNVNIKVGRDDALWDIDVARYIYSDEFKTSFKSRVQEVEKKNNLPYGDAEKICDEIFKEIIEQKGISWRKGVQEYACAVYAKVLFMFYFYGPVISRTKMLCIDEGQDICENQYLLVYEINKKYTCLNVYGDLSQRIRSSVNVESWEYLRDLLGASYYSLNENYRNSDNIVHFYNKALGTDNMALGVVTKNVEYFSEDDLETMLKLQLLLKNRTVIIAKEIKEVLPRIHKLCTNGDIEEGKVSVMSVKQVKGLEFDAAFVYDGDMDSNEKYISYTRALSELYLYRAY